MSDDDLRAVFAYLRTMKPITNHVPVPLPPPPAQTASTDEAPRKGANQ